MIGLGRAARIAAVAALAVIAGGCGDDAPAAAESAAAESAAAEPTGDGRQEVEVSILEAGECPGSTADADHPDVVAARFTPTADPSSWRVAVTLCSLYDTPSRYADAWRVTTLDGTVLGTRALLHDHAGEQPFTRSLGEPLDVPAGTTSVLVEARDLTNGWGGGTLQVDLG